MSSSPRTERETLFVENITIPDGRARALDQDTVGRLAESIQRLGLRTPITVRVVGDEIHVVAGRHRLEAVKRLGWEKIDCVYAQGDETDARLWEIAENLHRADLTALERSDHVAEWVRLVDAAKLGQLGPVSGGRGNQGGVRAASRELGMPRTDVRRAIKIANLSDAAKDAARDADLGDNQSALLAAAAKPAAAQADSLRDWAKTHGRKSPTTVAPPVENGIEAEERWRAAVIKAWNRGASEWRERLLPALDPPLFDRAARKVAA